MKSNYENEQLFKQSISDIKYNMVNKKHSIIETPNLGQIVLSDQIIKKFSQPDSGSFSVDELIDILQSSKIELVTFPNNDDFMAQGDEFWAHKASSTVFFVEKKGNIKIIKAALKTDISYLHFEND